ncbi:MAG: AAA family ATPase, partial [Lentisphaeria bacterium]|nr:AAA family ATPase [Lentisphaeria bacterium]
LRAEVHRVLVGQDRLVDGLLMALLAAGHVLIEGLPGLAKTLAVKALATAVGGTFRRIQFTPDLLPSDLIGTLVYKPEDHTFSAHRGPIFAHLLLADEINRAPAKVQSALLEAMQEGHVTIGGVSHSLPSPFLVLATQNPIEQTGTYPLPEAQLDRFLLKTVVPYPDRAEERTILERMGTPTPPFQLSPVTDPETVLRAREALDLIYMDGRILDYVLDIVAATRPGHRAALSALQDPEAVARLHPLLEYGASPRAALALTLCARCRALLCRRTHVIPQDVKDVAVEVLAHRLVLSFEAEAQGLDAAAIVQRVLGVVKAP